MFIWCLIGRNCCCVVSRTHVFALLVCSMASFIVAASSEALQMGRIVVTLADLDRYVAELDAISSGDFWPFPLDLANSIESPLVSACQLNSRFAKYFQSYFKFKWKKASGGQV